MSDIFRDSYFIFSNAAWIIMATNGSLSAASSILIMSIIIRSSPEARCSAYHMIMFFMSFWDTIVSIAIALNTAPMPFDVHEIYPFAGTAIGNISSCEAQGFLSLLGTGFILLSNTTLHLYYVCTLRFKMTEERFMKLIMPVMLVFTTALVTGFAVSALMRHVINPSPVYGICFAIPYPFGCTYDEVDQGASTSSIECIRGDGSSDLFYMLIARRILFGATFAIMVASLVLVILCVLEAEIKIRRSRRIQKHASRFINGSGRRSNRHNRRVHDFKKTRSAMIQALMYIAAYLLTYIWSFIFMAKFPTYTSESGPSNILSCLQTFFTPLQGFFNAVIFVYQKVHTLRTAKSDLSFFDAFKQVIWKPSSVPQQVISSMEIATEEIGERRQEDSRMRRGQSSISLRERVEANSSGLRRFGSNIQCIGTSLPDSHVADVGNVGDGDSSSLCLSNDISLGDILGPDSDSADDEDGSVSADSQSLPNDENLSSGTRTTPSANFSLSENTLTWSADLCSVIPEASHDDTKEEEGEMIVEST